MCVMIWCYCDDMCAMVCDGMVLCTSYLYMCYLCFEMQGFNSEQIKTKPTGTFVVCRHTAKRTKVLYRVQTHGKETICQQSVDLGGVFWTKWSENCRKTHGEILNTRQRKTHGEILEPTACHANDTWWLREHGETFIVCAQTHGKDMLTWHLCDPLACFSLPCT
jgi:hypothetical protein